MVVVVEKEVEWWKKERGMLAGWFCPLLCRRSSIIERGKNYYCDEEEDWRRRRRRLEDEDTETTPKGFVRKSII